MKDNLLATHLRTALLKINDVVSGKNILVQQDFQPQSTNSPTDEHPLIVFHKLGDRQIGFNKQESTYDEVEQVMNHVEEQWMETTFQVEAWVKRNITDSNQYTGSDLINLVSLTIKSYRVREFLQSQGIGILRVMDVRNPPVVDNFDQNEFAPSFDITLTHTEIIRSVEPVIQSTEYGIHRI